ncbi:hypothetical protein TrLO_g11597 [Triparma laevis f. longispina]|uniref:Uncharacterized protein n=1 Tax=Triparma laevis f. longispina TaxID=1714387 RepID=A0A9W7CJZ4_9STRA|nr:hypothetical protein TrLO_g11597 [Triparma laevis f. longispina]
MSSFRTPARNIPHPGDGKHWGDRRRRVKIALPKSLVDLEHLARHRYPEMAHPIKVFRNEGATEPLTNENFSSVKNGDVLIILDADNNALDLTSAMQEQYLSETKSKFTGVSSPAAEPVLPKDERNFGASEYRTEITYNKTPLENGAVEVEKIIYKIPRDDRNWLTEAKAQFTAKESPHKVKHQKDHYVPNAMSQEDRDWVTENHDRDWLTEAKSQFTAKESPHKVKHQKDHYVPNAMSQEDRDWVTENRANFTTHDNEVFCWLEPDMESSEVRCGHSHGAHGF